MSIRDIKRWWQVRTGRVDTPLDGEIPFWILSFGFHLVILLLLARVVLPKEQPRTVKLNFDSEEVIQLEELAPDTEVEEQPQEDIGVENDLEIEFANSAPEFEDSLEDEVPVEPDVPTYEIGDLLNTSEILEPVSDNITSVSVKGSVGTAATGASGAVDRITQEIIRSLEERKTLVVWMFDESASLLRQRQEIHSRFDKIYRELDRLAASGNKSFAKHEDRPLLTEVYGFGRELHKLTKDPTEDVKTIKAAIEKIRTDKSGIENVFSSIIAVTGKYESYRRINPATGDRKRNVMVIVVSDEAGDDNVRLDDCIKECNKNQIPVYVVGVPAPFGRKDTLVKWVDPDPNYDQTPQWAVVSQGPESVLPERIQLEYGSDVGDLEMIDSGFGPFDLTRLCYETGGIYFAVHPNRRSNRAVRRMETEAYSAYIRHFFDPEVMRRYKPDYVSRKTYIARVKQNKARQSLVEAANYTSTGVLKPPVLRFPKLNEATFVREVTSAQQYAAFVEPKLESLYEILKQGEKDRELETSRRWKVGYDLAMGRVLAAKLRANAYNDMLAMAKLKLKFKNEKNNTWLLRPDDAITTGSAAEKLAKKAKQYLNRVVKEHPDTPWAMLAQRELQTPIGYRWEEDFTEPPQPRTRANNNNPRPNPNPRVPQPRENAMPKPKRQPPRL